jgi:hypothetical protein
MVTGGGGPAVAVREADSQKRRVTFVSSLRSANPNTRRVACDANMQPAAATPSWNAA